MERFYRRIFLGCRAPVAAIHFLASTGEFLLLVESDDRCQEKPVHPILQTVCTNDAACCRRSLNPVRFGLAISCSIARAVPLLASILGEMFVAPFAGSFPFL